MSRAKWAIVILAVVAAPVYLAGCASGTPSDDTASLGKAVPVDAAPATPAPRAAETAPADAAPATAAPRSAEPAPYRVVSTEDVSIAGRSRTSLRVVIQDKNASAEQVHAALLEAAKTDSADKVMVFAYWPGDDTTSMYTAGRLEWGRDRRGWDGSDYIGPEGRFDQD